MKCEKSKRVHDLSGERFGRLVVLSFYGVKNRVSYWNCICDCGRATIASSHSLRQGNVQSCGCYHAELSSKLCKQRNFRHGYTNEPLYAVWKTMRQRCNNPLQHDYRWYGAKGIKVCKEWSDYPAFRQWALDNGYQQPLTIDRIDSNKNYCPSNCRFITIQEQQYYRLKAKEVSQ